MTQRSPTSVDAFETKEALFYGTRCFGLVIGITFGIVLWLGVGVLVRFI